MPAAEWRKDFFCQETGGYVATHVLKAKDVLKRHGIAVEVKACWQLATLGKRVLRLPENVLDKIDMIIIDGKKYRDLLKFKTGSLKPRGYPDVYFDGQTWDFKTSTFENEDSLRQTIKDGRKADNIILVTTSFGDLKMVGNALKSELGMRKKDKSWEELPNLYYWSNGCLSEVWIK